MNIQIETITTTKGKMDVIMDIEKVRRLIAELDECKAAIRADQPQKALQKRFKGILK